MWSSFPNAKNPKLWIDKRSNLKTAFSLYNPYSPKGKIAKKIVCMLPAIIGDLLLKPINSGKLLNKFNTYKNNIDKILNIDTVINISPGTKSKHQKTSIQIIHNEETEYYLKISNNIETIELSKNEYTVLNLLSTNPLTAFTPKAIFGDFIESNYYLIQSAAPKNFFQSEIEFSSAHKQCIIDFYNLHNKQIDIQDHINTLINNISNQHCNEKSNILTTLDALVEKHKKIKINLSFTHGDFAPWNILTNNRNELFIFDWEHGNKNSPLLFDFFHFHYMSCKLLTNNTAIEIKEYIDSLYLKKKYQNIFTHMNINNADYQLYSKLYLLQIITREIKENNSPSELTVNIFNIL